MLAVKSNEEVNASDSSSQNHQVQHNTKTLSGPSLRAFTKIVKLWKLDIEDAMVLLGEKSVELYKSWLREPEYALLSETQIKRISYLLSIHNAAQQYLSNGTPPHKWLRKKNNDFIFQGKTPLEYLLKGEMDQLHSLLFYLT